jgi:hypothetical protein
VGHWHSPVLISAFYFLLTSHKVTGLSCRRIFHF